MYNKKKKKKNQANHLLLFTKYLTMWIDDYSDDDEQQISGPKNGQITEKNPNYEKKDKCKCSKGCSKRTCICFKFGSGCNSSFGCGSSCQNMFNSLEYFFGNEKKYSANQCFS